MTYIVAGSRRAVREEFDKAVANAPGDWDFVDSPKSLVTDVRRESHRRFIFFVHWPWIVGPELVRSVECVGFHMSDLPYGRGGSPLQNLILRGHRTTHLTAFQLTEEIDAGPVYMREPLELTGTAEEIYRRAYALAMQMILRIVEHEPKAIPQHGRPVWFHRRTPEESQIPELGSLHELYDFIRMLDAEGYPRAYISHGPFRIEFRNAELGDDRLRADVTVRQRAARLP